MCMHKGNSMTLISLGASLQNQWKTVFKNWRYVMVLECNILWPDPKDPKVKFHHLEFRHPAKLAILTPLCDQCREIGAFFFYMKCDLSFVFSLRVVRTVNHFLSFSVNISVCKLFSFLSFSASTQILTKSKYLPVCKFSIKVFLHTKTNANISQKYKWNVQWIKIDLENYFSRKPRQIPIFQYHLVYKNSA